VTQDTYNNLNQNNNIIINKEILTTTINKISLIKRDNITITIITTLDKMDQ